MTETADATRPGLPLEVVERDEGGARPARRRRRLIFRAVFLVPFVMILLSIGGIVGLYYQPPSLQRFFEATGLQPGGGTSHPIALPPDVELPEDMAQTLQPTDVVGLARLMPEGDKTIVAPPFGAGDARLAELLVSEGDTVVRGDRLAILDNLDVLESAVLSAEADLAVREATLIQTRQSVATSIEEARADVERAEAASEVAEIELQRTTSLRDRGVSTQASFDQAQATAREADRELARTRATLSRYETDNIDEQPDVLVAQRNVDAAEADLARARRDLSQGVVVAPIDGTILDIFLQPGERPDSEGILEMGNTAQMMAEIEVFQSQIRGVDAGQAVELVADALGETLYGTVERIGLTVGRQDVVSDDTAANTDARVIDVLVRLDTASSIIASRFTDLEVIARIDTRTAQ
ncbi:HlyD family efflux transporter periplasmic adaptor subunit [Pontivivens ytuae]|uniref:HlyD family efflux transporter periplasmic adaptor subunit n=1 Tax=Pontivivens ytuae TaxID=2789856 RepID=A0A7S9QC31_9RHOB|nr:HlyD family efflux transporter periplasmic adaptor subunit [Pontivivens ytuae]QPH52656.1 HlyD family efflux transporter periplasmic adaptor subunit [Pontivivens ytuae]